MLRDVDNTEQSCQSNSIDINCFRQYKPTAHYLTRKKTWRQSPDVASVASGGIDGIMEWMGCIRVCQKFRLILRTQVTWLPPPRSEEQAHVCLPVRGALWWVLLQHSIMLRLFFIVECGIARFLCAMRVFDVQASSSSHRLPLCQILFLS